MKKYLQHAIAADGNQTRVQIEELCGEQQDFREDVMEKLCKNDDLTAAEHLAEYKKKKIEEKEQKDQQKAQNLEKREATKRKREVAEERLLELGTKSQEQTETPKGASVAQLWNSNGLVERGPKRWVSNFARRKLKRRVTASR